MLVTLLNILQDALGGRKRDHLVSFKYHQIMSCYGERCLDVGAGNGSFARMLMEQGRQVTAIDIVDKSTGVPVALFDGQRIPFGDHQFDTTMLMFVLHHAKHQAELIKECRRVTRGAVIVAEDVIENGCDRIMGRIHLGTSPWSKGGDGFRTDAGWREFFAHVGLSVAKTVSIPRSAYPVYPIRRIVYVLTATDHLPDEDAARPS